MPRRHRMVLTSGLAADYEKRTVDKGGEVRQACRIYRDARGRTRVEGTLNGVDFAMLSDFELGRMALVDPLTGAPIPTVSEPIPSPMSRGAVAAPNPPRVEELGERRMEGVVARGMRYILDSETVEVWTALEFDQPPVLVHVTGPGREETERLYNIRLEDPDPTLFAPLD